MRARLSLWIAAGGSETRAPLRVLGGLLTGSVLLAQCGCGSTARQILPTPTPTTRNAAVRDQIKPAPVNTGKIRTEISALAGEINKLVSAGTLTSAQGAAVTVPLDTASQALAGKEPDFAQAQRCLDRAFDKTFAALAGGKTVDPAVTTRLLYTFNVLTAVLRDGIGGVAYRTE